MLSLSRGTHTFMEVGASLSLKQPLCVLDSVDEWQSECVQPEEGSAWEGGVVRSRGSGI